MVTDIHLFTERRAAKDAPWELFAVTSECTWCDGSGKGPPHLESEPCWKCKGGGTEIGYSSRSYSTFAMLANVRNGRDFAGVDIGDGFNPVALQRGLPADMSAKLKAIHADSCPDEETDKLYGESWTGDHSHSYLTLRELLNYDWQQQTTHHGQCELRSYVAWKLSGEKFPENWCGDCSGPRVYHVPERLADLLASCIVLEPFTCAFTDFARTAAAAGGLRLDELDAWAKGTPGVSLYAPVNVKDSYASSAGAFHAIFLPALAAAGEPDNVRIVFGFDS